MDLRTRTSLFCGALALAIAASILLRGRARRAQLLFAAFAADIGLWYLAQWLYHFVRSEVWAVFTALLAVLLPQFALHLFEAVVPARGRTSTLLRVAGVLVVPMLVLVLSPKNMHPLVRGAIFLYVFGLIAAGLWTLWSRGERSPSRETQRRVRFLAIVGALATAFSLADFLWFIGAPLPPVGAVLSIVFLFLLAESLVRKRLVDLYDILGQLLVSTALAFCLAGIFYVFVVLVGGFNTMYLNAVLAAIVILVLFEPLRDRVQAYTNRALFRERVEVERAVQHARRELLHVLEIDTMMQVVTSAIAATRRATGFAVWSREAGSTDLVLGASLGADPPPRIDGATARPLLERLTERGSLVLETMARDAVERREELSARELEAEHRVLAAAELLGPHRESVVVAIRGDDGALVGLLAITDDRVKDAYSSEEVALFESLASQMGVVFENSRQHGRLQEQGRLAALGQMAAGLAHEVKNPLGAIKGAAQLLREPEGTQLEPGAQEFVTIILEEVARLDRVVGSVLDYARPSRGEPGAVDANAVVRRTLQVLAPDRHEGVELRTELDAALPLVRADAEKLRQVLINLVLNAVQATPPGGRVTVSTRAWPGGQSGADRIDVAVSDEGPGIAPEVREHLFVPFFSTKERGTGLGLAISQRMVTDMGGRIEVSSREGAGSTFRVVLPAVSDPTPAPPPGARPRREEPAAEPARGVP
ncbi:MAG: two-component system sensor protein [Polyangiaceae bacterium]|nr:two-component system sensor protein [Polyangiaceae bacterium]